MFSGNCPRTLIDLSNIGDRTLQCRVGDNTLVIDPEKKISLIEIVSRQSPLIKKDSNFSLII